MDKKQFAWIFVIGFFALTYYLWQNNDLIAKTIVNNGFQGLFWYFISNANYVLILISIMVLNTEVGFIRRTIGALMTVYSFDIVSFPRLSPTGLSSDIAILASSDGLVVQELLKFGMPYQTAYTFYYLVLPILLMVAALTMLGFAQFIENFVRKK